MRGIVKIVESANAKVAFNSPIDIAKAKAAEVAIAPFKRGSSILKKVFPTVAPKVRDAWR